MTTNTGTDTGRQRRGKRRIFVSLFLDVGVPIGSYYLLKGVVGMSAVAALGWSTVVPVLRTGWGVLKQRDVNALPLLILLANIVGLLLSFETGDARLLLVKDSAVASLVGFVMLGSVLVGRPMMTGTLKPWLVKGDADREAAWVRLRRESRAFRRAERLFTGVWGAAFVGECALRIVGVYSFSVDTMVWLGTVVMIVTMLVAFVVSGALGAGPMTHMIGANVREAEENSSLAGSTHG
ncbi:VC0807 family protein [Streptomyces sp. Tu 4128]|uniref:VC0807 family protein n=1 Tax=unclassified Streptomyces TaxID=2593676 RepID=UPI000F0298E7|nr:VC0807 family protein [Streptomyces sp. Tu 4128]